MDGCRAIALRINENQVLKLGVAAITKSAILALLAVAESHGFGLLDFHLDRREITAFVSAIAERLIAGKPAAAIVVGSRLDF